MKKSPPLVAFIFTDPIGWAGTMVGTRTRYIFTLVVLPLFILSILNNLSETSIVEHWSSALLVVGYHLMFVYALRALYLRVEQHEEMID